MIFIWASRFSKKPGSPSFSVTHFTVLIQQNVMPKAHDMT